MRPFLIFLLFFSYLISFAQCPDSLLIKTWGKWNELQYNSSVFRLEHRTSDSILPGNIRKIVKEAILNRCGSRFYAHLAINDLSIVIPLQKKQKADDLIAEGVVKRGEIKYYYQFLFTESPNIQYRFNLALDVMGNILTEWTIPKLKEDEFNTMVTFCEAATIGRNDKKAEVKKINDLALMYDPNLNHFGWKMTIGYKVHKEDAHYKSYRLSVNAFTGEIIDRWDADVKKYDDPTHK